MVRTKLPQSRSCYFWYYQKKKAGFLPRTCLLVPELFPSLVSSVGTSSVNEVLMCM